MGQRGAIMMFLFSGGILLPVIVLAIVAGYLGRSALPVGMFVECLGVFCLVFAKWPELAAGHLLSLGPKRLSARRRKFKLVWIRAHWLRSGVAIASLPLVDR